MDGVVPLAVKMVWDEMNLGEIVVRDATTRGIRSIIETATHGEARLRFCSSDEVDFVSVIDAHTGFLLSWRFDTETSRLWRLDYDNHSAHIGATMRGLLAKRVMPPSRSLTACTTTKSSLANEDIDG